MSKQRHLTIDGVDIDDGTDCYVIAEIGHNHQGDLEHAKRLIDAAKECGVKAVKSDAVHPRVLRAALRERTELRTDVRRASRSARVRRRRVPRAATACARGRSRVVRHPLRLRK